MQGERNCKKRLADFCMAEPRPTLLKGSARRAQLQKTACRFFAWPSRRLRYGKVVQGERNCKKRLADFCIISHETVRRVCPLLRRLILCVMWTGEVVGRGGLYQKFLRDRLRHIHVKLYCEGQIYFSMVFSRILGKGAVVK